MFLRKITFSITNVFENFYVMIMKNIYIQYYENLYLFFSQNKIKF